MRYVRVDDGVVVNATVFGAFASGGGGGGDSGMPDTMPDGWDSPNVWLPSVDAQIGWTYQDGEFAPPAVAPGPALRLTTAQAKAVVVAAIDQATADIIQAYPTVERLGWDAKAAEAIAVLAAGEGATLAIAPLLTAECIAEYGAADDATRLTQLGAKAQTVLDKAAAWGQLMATLSGLRGKAFAAIDAAGNDAEALQAAVDAASAEIAAAAQA